jgi:hypothetical protein
LEYAREEQASFDDFAARRHSTREPLFRT